MNQLSYPYALTPLQIQLSHRQRRQVLSRPSQTRRALAHLAARAFLPANDSLVFDNPIQPLGSVVLVVLSRRFVGRPDGVADEQVLVRGYTAQLDQSTAITHWGPETSAFLYDLGQPVYPNAAAPALPVEKTALVRVALDLDRQIERCARQHCSFVPYPSLPPTLLGFEPGTEFSPEPTQLVSAYAYRDAGRFQPVYPVLSDDLGVEIRTNSQFKLKIHDGDADGWAGARSTGGYVPPTLPPKHRPTARRPLRSPGGPPRPLGSSNHPLRCHVNNEAATAPSLFPSNQIYMLEFFVYGADHWPDQAA